MMASVNIDHDETSVPWSIYQDRIHDLEKMAWKNEYLKQIIERSKQPEIKLLEHCHNCKRNEAVIKNFEEKMKKSSELQDKIVLPTSPGSSNIPMEFVNYIQCKKYAQTNIVTLMKQATEKIERLQEENHRLKRDYGSLMEETQAAKVQASSYERDFTEYREKTRSEKEKLEEKVSWLENMVRRLGQRGGGGAQSLSGRDGRSEVAATRCIRCPRCAATFSDRPAFEQHVQNCT